MQSELEQIVGNIVRAISEMDVIEYPTLVVYRHHMELNVASVDQLHQLFNLVDLTDPEFKDLLKCHNAEVFTLHGQVTGIRIEKFDGAPAGMYWLGCNETLRGDAMSEFYDTVATFMESIDEEHRKAQCVELGLCGGLINWRSALNHIVNNPRELVLGSLDHPKRFFTPSTTLYVSAKDRRDDLIIPVSSYVSEADALREEPRWFTVRKDVRSTTVL